MNSPKLGQYLRLEQRLSPQQILLSSLLQLPTLALEQRIKAELETNPLLEEGEELEEEVNAEVAAEPEQNLEQGKPEEEKGTSEPEKEEKNKDEEFDIEDYLNDEESYQTKIPFDASQETYEKPEAASSTLSDYLLTQLHELNLTKKLIAIGEYIIGNIDEDGYLTVTLEEIATAQNCVFEEAEKGLHIVQKFDPVGIGARDLKECLLIQLHQVKNGNAEIPIRILEQYYEDFRNKRFEKLSTGLAIPLEEVKTAMDAISRLNPKPGEGYINQQQNYVIPDLTVEKVDDQFMVSLNDGNIPSLRISRTYKQMLLDRKKTPKQTRDYIRQRIESAKWLIASIYQRKMTMLKVMNAIVEKQHDFFEKGPGNVKPLILKDIAEIVNMDISTISRVTNGKYVQTDYGVLELKYFFSESMEMADGEEVSTKNIKSRIQEIIENEDKKKPIKDEQIVNLLEKEGYQIARRTVAKYREQMMIPVARLRREI